MLASYLLMYFGFVKDKTKFLPNDCMLVCMEKEKHICRSRMGTSDQRSSKTWLDGEEKLRNNTKQVVTLNFWYCFAALARAGR
jgi:hypothetical protein